MNNVITINLNGKAYQLEEPGAEALRSYLEKAKAKLAGNPDQDEIMKDFEQAVAEKCDKYLSAHKNVVSQKEIETIIAEMGPVATDTDPEPSEPAIKRLYRIREGAWIAGVCNGIAAYFNIDVKIVRVIFFALALITKGGAIALYILMAFFIPAAVTNEERAFARGKQFNAQEFMAEMKEKYGKYAGKYAEEEYWKEHPLTKKNYASLFTSAWWKATRIGTGIFTIIGSITLVALAVIYSIVMWTIVFHGSMLDNKLLFGASPILLGLFVSAVAYIAIWPLKKMVREARLHAWNIPKRKHRARGIVGLILWIIAIGFAITVGTLSIPEQNKEYKPYGNTFWISHREFCIGGNYFCNPAQGIEERDSKAVQQVVYDFGKTLQEVSLLGPSEILKPQMATAYGPYLTPALLKEWQAHPDTALGRQTSSPYPDHISIDSTTHNPDGSYTVTGEIKEMAYVESGRKSVVARTPITLTLINTDQSWRISAITK